MIYKVIASKLTKEGKNVRVESAMYDAESPVLTFDQRVAKLPPLLDGETWKFLPVETDRIILRMKDGCYRLNTPNLTTENIEDL